MAAQFRRIGDGTWPNANEAIRCGVYEWCLQTKSGVEDFSIRFLSPDEEAPRVYSIEPLLRQWLTDDTNRFLETACAKGYAILAQLEPQEHSIIYEVAQALFRNRHAGHIGVGRQFTWAVDFLDAQPGRCPLLLGAGLGTAEPIRVGKSRSVHRIAQAWLREALRKLDPNQPGIVGFSDVLKTYLSLWSRPRGQAPARQGADTVFAFDKVPLHSTLDLLFTDGRKRDPEWSWNQTAASVRSALIYGPVTDEDFQQVVSDQPAFKRFFENLLRSVQSRTSEEFDRWFRNAREHRYLALVGASRTKGPKREAAAEQAERIACAWMWISYLLMARCYGALMMIVWLQYCLHSDPAPTEAEQWLFRQWHLPQLYLAGLPLDFLGRAQLRCVLGGLHELWHNRVYDPEAYDGLTGLLGWFGHLLRERRAADRNRKAEGTPRVPRTCHGELLGDRGAVEPRSPAGIADATSPWFNDPDCPDCGCQLSLVRDSIGRLDKSTLLATFHCSGCDRVSRYRLDLTLWQSIARRAQDSSGT